MKVLLKKTVIRPFLFLRTVSACQPVQKPWQHLLGILADGVIAVGDTPVIHDGALKDGVGLGDVVHGEIVAEEAGFLAIDGDLPQQPVVGAVGIQKMALPLGGQLGTEELGEERDGNRVLDHQEQLMIHQDELFDGIQGRVHGFHQFFIFFVEEIRQGAQQGIFGLEVVIEGALRHLGFLRDVVDGGILIAVVVEQLPGRGDDAALRLICIFAHIYTLF